MRPSRSLLINAVGVVIVVAALVLVGRLSNRSVEHGSPATSSTGLPSGVLDHPTTAVPSPVVAKLSLGEPVDAVAASPGAVWAASGCAVWRINPKTSRVVARVAGTGAKDRCVVGLATGGGAVWGVMPGEGLLRIDPRSNRVVARILVGPVGESIAVGAGGVWLVCCGEPVPHGAGLVRVDPVTNRVVARIGLGGQPVAVGVGPSGVWVAGGPLWRIDPRTNRVVATLELEGGTGGGPAGVVVRPDAVWVAAVDGARMLRINPRTNQLVGSVDGPDGGGVAVVGGTVWVTGYGGLLRLAPPSDRVVSPEVMGSPLGRLAVSPGAVWVAAPAGLFRLDPDRLRRAAG